MIRYNPEIKSYVKSFFILFIITIVLCVGTTFSAINIIKDKVIENNQAIIGQIISQRPEVEEEIIDIITQGNSKENINLGKEILAKYNYGNNLSLTNEPIIKESMSKIFIIFLILICFVLIVSLILAILYFRKIYKDIKDMTDYVYNSSEGRNFDMKNRNQEGQIGLLKTELIKMINILKEKVELLNNEKILKKEYSLDIIKKLVNENIIKINKVNKYRINIDNNSFKKKELTLEQKEAVDKVEESFNKSEIFLLHGVTGSGKTEVYMELIEKVVKTGKCAILLVPEISLTHQIVSRFYSRFGSDVAIFHSALSDGEKYDEYHKILNGDAHIVVGTRSAIFVPFEKIGIIILDEEQSSNYKQDNNPRYHARDIALLRSEYHNCPVVLGSATPSLETMARAKKGVYTLLSLTKRIGKSVMPTTKIVDMQEEYKKRNMIISDYLDQKIREKLEANEQVLLMLNRRGFSTIVNCKNCGYTFKCPHCEISLTYHKTSNNLRCHYCGYTINNPDTCPSCMEKSLTNFGLGTEKLEEEINKRYNVKTVRMDADTTSKKGSQDEIIAKIESEDVSIIVGTQMISKGFDFPKVTLAAIINADDSLNIPDFRSGENTFELITQTIGRAGRASDKSDAVIQTFNSDNKIIEYAKNNDYESLYNYEMNIRKILKYPPYFYITKILITSKDYNEASKEISKVKSYLDKKLTNVIILGPTTAAMFKINNVYRFQIILKYKAYNLVKEHLKYLDDVYRLNSKINIEIDNNPTRA